MAGIPALKLLVVLSVAGVVLLFLLPSSTILAQSHEALKSLQQNAQEWITGNTATPVWSGEGVIVNPDEFATAPPSDIATASSSDTATASSSGIATVSLSESAPPVESTAASNKSAFNFDKWFFQADIYGYPLPNFDVPALGDIPPQNYRGHGHETFATYFATRNSSMADPYFIAAQQIVYRLLWDPRSKTEKHPVTVFVAPFISDEQRSYFKAAGALVRELPLIEFNPEPEGDKTIAGRLIDMFSKLELWNQTEFSRIAYLDSDAFPVVNIDKLFELAPERRCQEDYLPAESIDLSETCNYVLAAYMENEQTVNAGVMILKPDAGMHELLLREYHSTTDFDYGFVEQAFLSYFFRSDGPFPPSTFGKEYNTDGPERKEKGLDVFILHTKIWGYWFGETHWAAHIFNDTWVDMLHFYEADGFADLRLHNGYR